MQDYKRTQAPPHFLAGPKMLAIQFAENSSGHVSAAVADLKKALAFVLTAASVAISAPQVIAAEQTATFAGGCFWCIEADFQKLDGVSDVVSGFTGGKLQNPTYRGNHKGHYEAIQLRYDDEQVSYAELLDYFWRHIDPLDAGGQFCDRGFSYKTAIFVGDEQERVLAETSLQNIDALFPQDVATVILPSSRFWPVEAYHQDYADKNPVRYKYYRWNCGRDQRVKELWGDKE